MFKYFNLFLIIFVVSICCNNSVNAGFKIPSLSEQKYRTPFQCVSQDALILYDKNNEKLIMEFKYKGDIENFAWVIPFPTKPSVLNIEVSPFEELKSFYKNPIIHTPLQDAMNLTSVKKMFSLALEKKKENNTLNDSVKVINRKNIGIYDTVILSTSNPDSLKKWLKKNGFSITNDSEKIIKYYTAKKYYWLALKVAFKVNKAIHSKFTNSGTLPPVAVEFKSKQPYYPLYSFADKKDSMKLNLYVLAKNIYSNEEFLSNHIKTLSVIKLARKLYDYTYVNAILNNKTKQQCLEKCRQILPIFSPIMFFKVNNVLPSIETSCPEINSGTWYCMKYNLSINKSDIKKDILLSPDKDLVEATFKKIIDEQLNNKYKYSNNTNPSAFVFPESLEKEQNPAKQRLTFLLKNNKYGENWTKKKIINSQLINALIKQDLLNAFVLFECKDTNDKINFLDAYISTTNSIPNINSYPLFRSCIPNIIESPVTKTAENLLPLLSVEYSFKASFKAKLFNSKYYKIPASLQSTEAKRQYFALIMMYFYHDPLAGKVFSNWLTNDNKSVRRLALNIISVSLRNDREYCLYNYGLNKRPYLYYKLSDSEKMNVQNQIKNVLINFPVSSRRAIYILYYLNAPDFKETINSVLESCANVYAPNIEKLKSEDRLKYHKKLTATSNLVLLYMRLFPDEKFISGLNTAINNFKNSPGWGIDYKNLLWTIWSIDLYKKDELLRANLYKPEIIKQISNPPNYKKIKFSVLNEYVYYIASIDPKKPQSPHFQYLFPSKLPVSAIEFLINKINNMKDVETQKLYLKKLTYSICLSFEDGNKNKISSLLKFLDLTKKVLPKSGEYRRILEVALDTPTYIDNKNVRDIILNLENIKIIAYDKNIYPFGTVKTKYLSLNTIDYLIKLIKKQNVFLQKTWINSMLPSLLISLKTLQIKNKINLNFASDRMQKLFEIVGHNPDTAKAYIKLLQNAIGQLCINNTSIQKFVFNESNVEKLKKHKLRPVSVLNYKTIEFILNKMLNSKDPSAYWTTFRNSIFKSIANLIKKDKNNLKVLPLLSLICKGKETLPFRDNDKLMLFKLYLAGDGVNSISVRNEIFCNDIIFLVASSSKLNFKSSHMNYDTISWFLRNVADMKKENYNKWWKALGVSILSSMKQNPDNRYIRILCRYCNVILNKDDSPVQVMPLIKTVFSKHYINDPKIKEIIFNVKFLNKFKNQIKKVLNTSVMTEETQKQFKAAINSMPDSEKSFWQGI